MGKIFPLGLSAQPTPAELPPTATPPSPKSLGRLFRLQVRRSPRQTLKSPAVACILRRTIPTLQAWEYGFTNGANQPRGPASRNMIVRPSAQFLIVGSGRRPFSPHTPRRRRSDFCLLKSSSQKADSLYAQTRKNIKQFQEIFQKIL